MPAKRFKAKLGDREGIPVIELPFDVKAEFGKARPPLIATINAYSFRTTPAVYGGKSYIGVRRSHREAGGLEIGTMVDVKLEPDTEARIVKPPPDLAAALKKNAKAKAAWEKLSYTHQKEHVEAILEAKKAETRERRVQKAIEMLGG